MEQSTGPIIPPMHTAGTDPGYIPGLTSPRPADVEEDAPDKAAAERPPEEVTAEDEPEPDEDGGVEAEAESDSETGASKDVVASDGEADDEEDADADEDNEEDGGAVFEVSDRRGAIRAGRRGVTFELDGEKAEFGWDEIGAVEVDTPRFGKRFGITVYTTNQRWYTADVEAPARKLLKEWTAELDAVLDAYFEDSEDGGAEAEAKSDEAKDTDAENAKNAKGTDAKDATS
ncbi:hypothetical protein [Streptomyces sp. 5-6(2022)]|uniref:hypothetical protein n=1 Tax=Streptomyces sp. 5-6(2022) TaxID=2936510 RepID=UPI0023B9CEEB|nr:hypothetical protein [Streptomyces sp. 5-6(2022)]